MKRDHCMKKSLIAIWTLTLAAAMPLMAETEEANGYTWTYCINDEGVGFDKIGQTCFIRCQIGDVTSLLEQSHLTPRYRSK